jgi:hypothetical protein
MNIATNSADRRAHAVTETRLRLADVAGTDRWKAPATPEEAVTVLLEQAARVEEYLNAGTVNGGPAGTGSGT